MADREATRVDEELSVVNFYCPNTRPLSRYFTHVSFNECGFPETAVFIQAVPWLTLVIHAHSSNMKARTLRRKFLSFLFVVYWLHVYWTNVCQAMRGTRTITTESVWLHKGEHDTLGREGNDAPFLALWWRSMGGDRSWRAPRHPAQERAIDATVNCGHERPRLINWPSWREYKNVLISNVFV